MDQAPNATLGPGGDRGDGIPTRAASSGLTNPRAARPSPGLFKELVFHLVKRQLDSTHRMTVLGWAWPLVRQLVQLAVLVFIFGSVLNLGIENFAIFVFTGLIAWTWFSTGLGAATSSLIDERHLLYFHRLPPAVIPIVAVVVPLVDVMMALPVLGVMLLFEGGVPTAALAIPILIVVQLILMAGIAWLTAAGSVFFRDIPNLVIVGLTVLFYLTPVFYGLHNVPERYAVVLKLNPMATIVNTYRALLLGEPYPGNGAIAYTLLLSAGFALVGFFVFMRSQDRFVDSL
jgi:lipopolysaccharide transport system permease protein